jgi:hypothetical protein
MEDHPEYKKRVRNGFITAAVYVLFYIAAFYGIIQFFK